MKKKSNEEIPTLFALNAGWEKGKNINFWQFSVRNMTLNYFHKILFTHQITHYLTHTVVVPTDVKIIRMKLFSKKIFLTFLICYSDVIGSFSIFVFYTR